MTDVVVDRLRIVATGVDLRALAGIAARALPGALERALADVEDGAIGALHVRLELDPADYDETTLAVLWADAVRRTAIADGARTVPPAAADRRAAGSADATGRRGGEDPSGAEPRAGAGLGPGSGATRAKRVHRDGGPLASTSPEVEGKALVAQVVAVAAGWIGAGAPADAVPVALLGLADRAVATAVSSLLGRSATEVLASRLRAVTWPAASQTGSVPGGGLRPRTDVADRTPSGDQGPGGRPTEPPLSGRLAHLAGQLQELAALADGGRLALDLGLVTRTAGVTLLYPWLAELCRSAAVYAGVDDLPENDPTVVDVRRLLLAMLVDPADRTLPDDPLIRLLAGAPAAGVARALQGPAGSAAGSGLRTRLGDSADDALRRFGGLLPGFGGSSPDFVRTSWLVRDGVISTVGTAVRLTARAKPLDLVLQRLPYPVGLIRLPWTPPVSVVLR